MERETTKDSRFTKAAEERRQAFGRMLDEVRAEARRKGAHSVDSVIAELDQIILAEP